MKASKFIVNIGGSMLLVLSLSNCGAGGDGDSISLVGSDGQSPDPVVVEIPIAYIKRIAPSTSADEADLRDPTTFNPGAKLLLRNRASSNAEEVDITQQIITVVADELNVDSNDLVVDIKDLEPAFDGTGFLFAARVVPIPVDNNLEDTTWNLWTYDIQSNTASYVIPSPAIRDEAAIDGSSQDTAPQYLPDGRIVFSSTRQSGNLTRLTAEGRPVFIAADESRNGPASVLHIYDPDNGSFEQISFNPSHDLDPTVIDSGEIIFTRWDNAPGNNRWSLYSINPSGRQLSLHYGYNSHLSGSDPNTAIEFTQPRQLEDGRLLTILKPALSQTRGGDIVLIDSANFVEYNQPTWDNQGSSGKGQTPLTDTDVQINDPLSPAGQFSAAFPLHDGTNRVLVAWNQCRATEQDLTDPLFLDDDPSNDPEIIVTPCRLASSAASAAPLLYGLWIFDPSQGTQRPILTAAEGSYYSEIIAIESRSFPSIPADEGSDEFNVDLIDPQTMSEGYGLLKIDSVYDFDGVDDSELDGNDDIDVGIAARANPADAAYPTRPARFLRLLKPVPLPDPDNDNFDIPNAAFGVNRSQLMREILGTVPIEPDGSVTVKVPANIPFAISVLDVNGRRISERHSSWLQLSEGEILHCTGCHSSDSQLPHGRLNSQPTSANPGAQSLFVDSGTGIGFANTKVDRSLFPSDFLDGGNIGQTMATIYDLQRPLDDKQVAARSLMLSEWLYTDEWSAGLNPDPALDYSYGADWVNNPTVTNSQAIYVNRIVINYIDHIQPIWERSRTMENNGTAVLDSTGAVATNCIACHRSNTDDNSPAEMFVPAGQLDLSRHSSANNYYRSYNELLRSDTERVVIDPTTTAFRTRSCTAEQDDGMGGTEVVPVADPSPPAAIPPSMRAGAALSSLGFFNCFENGGDNCGVFVQNTATPANCIEVGTQFTDPQSFNHNGWLSPAELRLLSEWLDIGGQYYNDPFHSGVDTLQ